MGPTIRFNSDTREVHRASLPKSHWLAKRPGRAHIAQARAENQPLLFRLWHWNGKIVDGHTGAEVMDFNQEIKPFSAPDTQ